LATVDDVEEEDEEEDAEEVDEVAVPISDGRRRGLFDAPLQSAASEVVRTRINHLFILELPEDSWS